MLSDLQDLWQRGKSWPKFCTVDIRISRISAGYQGYQPDIRGYQPDIKATCTPDIRSYYPLFMTCFLHLCLLDSPSMKLSFPWVGGVIYNLLLIFQMLDTPQTDRAAVDHDGRNRTQFFAFLHTMWREDDCVAAGDSLKDAVPQKAASAGVHSSRGLVLNKKKDRFYDVYQTKRTRMIIIPVSWLFEQLQSVSSSTGITHYSFMCYLYCSDRPSLVLLHKF